MAILLVVVGHSFDPSTLGMRVIFSFHIPFFFFVSGYLQGRFGTAEERLRSVAAKSFRRLMVPYLATGAMGFVYWLVFLRFWSEDHNPVLTVLRVEVLSLLYGAGNTIERLRGTLHPVGAIWFLPALFASTLLFWLLLRATSRLGRWSAWGAAAGLAVVGVYLGRQLYLPWSLDIVLVALVWVLAGHELG